MNKLVNSPSKAKMTRVNKAAIDESQTPIVVTAGAVSLSSTLTRSEETISPTVSTSFTALEQTNQSQSLFFDMPTNQLQAAPTTSVSAFLDPPNHFSILLTVNEAINTSVLTSHLTNQSQVSNLTSTNSLVGQTDLLNSFSESPIDLKNHRSILITKNENESPIEKEKSDNTVEPIIDQVALALARIALIEASKTTKTSTVSHLELPNHRLIAAYENEPPKENSASLTTLPSASNRPSLLLTKKVSYSTSTNSLVDQTDLANSVSAPAIYLTNKIQIQTVMPTNEQEPTNIVESLIISTNRSQIQTEATHVDNESTIRSIFNKSNHLSGKVSAFSALKRTLSNFRIGNYIIGSGKSPLQRPTSTENSFHDLKTDLAKQFEGSIVDQNRAHEIVRVKIGLALDEANRDKVLLRTEYDLLRHNYDQLLNKSTDSNNHNGEFHTCIDTLRNENISLKVLINLLFFDKFIFFNKLIYFSI